MRLRRILALLVTMIMVAAACSSRSDDTTTTASSDGEATEADADEPAEDVPGTLGDLVGLCGPNEGGGEVPGADESETLGLTPDSIAVGTIADPGFTGRPGLNIEMHDAAEAFVGFCNEAGGINGKQIDLTLRDAALTEYQPIMEQACANDFAIVGSGAVQDNLYADVGVGCNMVDVAGFSVTPEKAGTAGRDPIEARSVQPIPNPSDQQAVGSNIVLAEEAGSAVDRTGILFADLQTLITQSEKVKAAWEAIGHTFVHEATYNVLGEANWAPFAAALREDAVEYLVLVGEGQNMALLQQSLAEVGYEIPYVVQDANFYDPEYLTAAGPVADGTYVRTVQWPFEEAADNPATQQYIDLVEAEGGKVASLGVSGMSAWALFAQSAKACDLENNLTRTCVLEEAASVSEWTGAGLHAPTDPGGNTGGECGITLIVVDGAFERFAPTDEDYDCSPDNVVPVEVDLSSG